MGSEAIPDISEAVYNTVRGREWYCKQMREYPVSRKEGLATGSPFFVPHTRRRASGWRSFLHGSLYARFALVTTCVLSGTVAWSRRSGIERPSHHRVRREKQRRFVSPLSPTSMDRVCGGVCSAEHKEEY